MENNKSSSELLKVQAGVSSVLTTLKRMFLSSLKEYFQSILRGDADDKTSKTVNSDGSVTYKLKFAYPSEDGDVTTGSGQKFKEFEFYVNGLPTDDSKEYVDLSFKYPDLKNDFTGSKMKEVIDKYKSVPNTENGIIGKCLEFLMETYGTEDIDLQEPSAKIGSSRLLKFTATKVNSSKNKYKFKISNIYANYSYQDVRSDIDTILGDTQFSDTMLVDSPTPYGVRVSEAGYDLEKLNNFLDSQHVAEYVDIACNAILDQAYKFYCDCKFFEYVACGCDKDRIVGYAESYAWRIQDIINIISKKLVEYHIFLYNPCSQIRRSQNPTIYEEQGPGWAEFETTMCQDIQELLYVLTLYSSNFCPADESMIQEWIRDWSTELNYNLCRQSFH